MGQSQAKVVLVTGGGSGFGKAASMAFARDGARVMVADVSVENGEETVTAIRQAGGEASFVKADVSSSSEVEAMVKKTVQTYGRLDCAFNNAGIVGTAFVSMTDYSEEVWDRVIAINLKGVWLCMKYEIPVMAAQGSGAIVNTSSIAGLRGGRVGAAYYASKHGIIGLTKAAAVEYASAGIRVNAVCPSWMRTALTNPYTETNPQREEQFIAMHPMGRLGTPEEVAAAVVWLCSDAASFITGHALPIDGGRLAQ
jgi:NAD(P)-dependent dehydrogenase (short-subunit alcohol dehydrogenase family)